MALADILVCLDPTEAGETRLRLAAGLAAAHGSRLSATYVLLGDIAGDGFGITAPSTVTGVAPGALVAGIPAPDVLPAAPSPAMALAELTELRFRDAAPASHSGDWHLYSSDEDDAFLALTRCFDLIVCGQESPDYPVPGGFRPADMTLGSGRPVLVVPYAGDFQQTGNRVLIAWDGTREAARALHDSLPVIRHAEAVTVVTVASGERDFERMRGSLDSVVRHLGAHRIPARAEETPQGDLTISDVLLSRAADLSADLMVAGGYHHSQLREALLGGVSRDLLDHMTLPVLISH